jgi:RibD domain-containing protein
MPKLRLHNFSISLDGYAAGPDQSVGNPLGVGGTRLHEWAFATRSGRATHGMEGGAEGVDDDFIAQGDAGIGATIMGTEHVRPDSWDVRLGGGVATIQQYLRAGLIDELHLAIVPVLLGAGERLFDNLDGPVGYEPVELTCSPSVAHVRLARAHE